MSHTSTDPTIDPTIDPSSDSSSDVLDEEWQAAPGRRSRVRVTLVLLLGASLVFLGGVEVQRHFGTTAATASAAPAGFPGGAGLPSGFPAGAAGGAEGAQPDTGGSTGGDEASVIGTVRSVKGDVWTIEDLGGTVHKVTVSDTVRIVRESSVDATDVEEGATVDIAGTTGEDGQVTATTITLR